MTVTIDFSASLDMGADVLAKQDEMRPYCAGDNVLTWMREISRSVVTPAYILRRLASSSDAEMKMAVADHLNTPASVLVMLSQDENPDVRFALAENHNMSRDLLVKLSLDSNPYVAHRAQITLSRLDRAVDCFNSGSNAWTPCFDQTARTAIC